MKDLTKGNTFLILFKFAIPLIIAGVVAQSYNLIDLIVAGNFIGSDALSATGCTSTLIQFLSSLFWGFGVAVSAIVGKLYGSKQYERIPVVIKTVSIFVSGLMALLCVGFIVFSRQTLVLLKVDEEIFEAANSYFRIFMVSLFIQALNYIWTCTLQSLGDSLYPMAMTLVSGLGNIGLNLLFVITFNMGINGLAYASILSCLISLIMGVIRILVYIKKLGGNYRLEFSFFELKKVSKLALPCILQQCSLYLSSVVVQPLINNMGKQVSGGYAIAMNVNTFLNAIYHNISRAVSAYVAQSKGAKQYNNYKKGVFIGIVQQLCFVIPLTIICIVFANPIFSIFMRDNDVSCLPYATQFAYICIPFLAFSALGNLMHSFYKSVGAVKSVLFSTIIFSIARIVLSYLIPNVDLINNIYWGLALAWIIEDLLLIGIYFIGIWKTNNHKLYESSLKNNKESR